MDGCQRGSITVTRLGQLLCFVRSRLWSVEMRVRGEWKG